MSHSLRRRVRCLWRVEWGTEAGMTGNASDPGRAAMPEMTELPDWVPEGVDLATPSVARVYDYVLGGGHNFAVDREFAREFLAVVPDARVIAQANRPFLHPAVRFMIPCGFPPFLDLR